MAVSPTGRTLDPVQEERSILVCLLLLLFFYTLTQHTLVYKGKAAQVLPVLLTLLPNRGL